VVETNCRPASEHPNFALNKAIFTQWDKSCPSYASERRSPKNLESQAPVNEILQIVLPLVASPVTGKPAPTLKYKTPCIQPSGQSVVLSKMLAKTLVKDKADVARASFALLVPNSSETVSSVEREILVATDAATAKSPPVSERFPDVPSAFSTATRA
jgi:hypothetical protein